MQSSDQLEQRFGIPGVLKFEIGPGGLTRVAVTGQHATATIYLHGAHVALFQPRDQKPVLFVSANSYYQEGKPIRGGVPVIFPWFGPHPTDPQAPAHGLVRLVEWTLVSTAQRADDAVELVFTLEPIKSQQLRYTINIGTKLELALEVHNAAPAPLRFEEALHSYFAISDIKQCTVTGLENTLYSSTPEGVKHHPQGAAPIQFTQETDRLYHDTHARCVIHDPGWQRRIVIDKSGSETTVVWNPWIAKAKAMADYGDDEWPEMVCIETANARDNAITIAPGQSHTMRAMIHVEPL